MNWYEKAQENLKIIQEDLPDRTRLHLMDENKDKEVGKLTIQIFPYDKYYYATAFFIDADYRGQGWGRKMMKQMTSLPRFQDRPIILNPEPYGGNIGSDEYNQEIEDLKKMYRKLGFENDVDNWMIYKGKNR